jgi:DUF4097 and DUF4098 domain-containing protein YvlB
VRSETFQTPRPVVVRVKLPKGDVDVETADVQQSTVTLVGSSPSAEEQIERAVVRLDSLDDFDELIVDADTEDFGWSAGRVKLSISLGRRDDVDVRIVVPHGSILRAETGSADLRARGQYAEIETKGASGDVSIDDVERDAAVKVASGDVRVSSVGGSLKVQTAAGDLSSGPVAGSAEIKTAAGDVNIAEVGEDVTIHSASGDLRVGSVKQGKVELKSVSGDMLVGVKRGSRVWMDVKTVTGDASSDLDTGLDDDGEGPLVELKATAMSGDIKIVRA